MMPARTRCVWLAPLLLLASCGAGEEPAPGGVTQSEKQALDDAAEMLDKANNAADLPRDPEPPKP